MKSLFSRISRYHTLPDIVTTDARGRTLLSKTLRPLPQAPGTFRHTVEDADRLDHLAYKYYRQPTKWWRLSDANPEFLSPQALLGKEPIVTDRFPLEFDGAQPPWASLVQNLTQHVGVEKVEVMEEIRLTPKAQTVRGRRVIASPRAVRTRDPRDLQPVEHERQGVGGDYYCLGLCHTSAGKAQPRG